jgi:quercetin dioxygenase-like cupin family protein
MPWPDFIDAFPGLDTPFLSEVVSMRALRGPDGLAVFFTFHRDLEVPMHSHGPQWGVLIRGRAVLTIGGETRSYGPGETWDIRAGVVHGGHIAAGTELIDVFAEADRYPLRPQP